MKREGVKERGKGGRRGGGVKDDHGHGHEHEGEEKVRKEKEKRSTSIRKELNQKKS